MSKNYHPESAGSVMINNVPRVGASASIFEVEKLLIKKAKEFDTINYIYVIDDEKKLIGAASIKEIFQFPKITPVSQIMTKDLITVRPNADQERVALLSIEHNLKAIPVVDAENHFLGVVPSDIILNILHQESIEDILRSAGILHKFKDPAKDLIFASAATYFQKRLPWLIIGLFGGLIAAFVVGFFQHILNKMLILAAFIPAVAYIAGAVGTQTQTVFIRSLTLNSKLNFKKYLLREIKVGLSLALILGLVIFMLSFLFWQSLILGTILAVSFFVAISVAMLIAIFLPLLFYKINYDPAIASGPFAIAISDIVSILIYFVVSSLVLSTII